MTALKCLTAVAAALALSLSAAAACDDFDQEIALADAMKAQQSSRTATAEPAQATQSAAPATTSPDATNVAAVEKPEAGRTQ
jgi:hypothetical protein